MKVTTSVKVFSSLRGKGKVMKMDAVSNMSLGVSWKYKRIEYNCILDTVLHIPSSGGVSSGASLVKSGSKFRTSISLFTSGLKGAGIYIV